MYSKRIIMKSDYEEIKNCREAVRQIAEEQGFIKEFDEAIELSLGEVLTNVIEHAQYGIEVKEPIEIIVIKNESVVEIEIVFKGETISDEELERKKELSKVDEIHELSESGRGVFIIHYLMDKVEYLNDGEYGKIKFTKNINI